jgi:TRAP-type C4-dicarboxylate transport system substrate-binding protein
MYRLWLVVLWSLVVAISDLEAATLKIATLSPEGTSWMTRMRAAGRHIEERTRGRVTLRFYPGGVMGDYATVLRKIRIGQLHGGAVTSGALTDLLPDANIYGLPFLFRDLDEVDWVRRRIDPLIERELEAQGMVSAGFAGGGFSYLMSKTPIRTLADARTRKVWSPAGDPVSETGFTALGISPISLPLTDVLTGLQTGLVDTVASPAVGAIVLQWHTQVRYLLDLPLTYVYGTLVLADKALKRLSEQDRAVVLEVLRRVFREMDAENRHEDAEARSALRGQGIEFLTPHAAQRKEWERTIETAISQLRDGRYFSPGLVARVRALVQEYRAGR